MNPSVTTTIAIRCRPRKWSTGANAANPIGARSGGGFSTASNAGNNVMLLRKAITIPAPAISPSSESPR